MKPTGVHLVSFIFYLNFTFKEIYYDSGVKARN